MKRPVRRLQPFVAIVVLTSIFCLIFICCNNQAAKNENTESTSNDTIKKPDTTNATYLNDVKSYRAKMADTMSAINKKITEYTAKLDSDKRKVKADYKKEIADLNQKGKDLKNRLDHYQSNGKQDWEKFKVDFTHDIDTLSKQIKELTASKK